MRWKWEDLWLVGAAMVMVAALWLAGRHRPVPLPAQPTNFQGLLNAAVHGAVKPDYSDLADITVGATQYNCKIMADMPVQVVTAHPAGAPSMVGDDWCTVAVQPYFEYGTPEHHLRTVLLHRQGARWVSIAVGTFLGWNRKALKSAHVPPEILRQAGISLAAPHRGRLARN